MLYILTNILVAILATYCIAILVSEYDGAFGIFAKARRSRLSGFLSCAVCSAVWVAVPLSIALNLGLVQYLAVVGGAVLLARNT